MNLLGKTRQCDLLTNRNALETSRFPTTVEESGASQGVLRCMDRGSARVRASQRTKTALLSLESGLSKRTPLTPRDVGEEMVQR